MADDPGLTTAEQAETQLETARRVFATVLSQHELDRHGNDGIGLAIWACPACGTAMQAFESAARATVQTRVEALLLAAEKVFAFEAQYPLDDTAYNDDEYDRGRAVHGELRAAVAALTATEQGPETEGEA